MPRFRSLLRKAVIETAKAQRTCKRSKVEIPKGEQCLVVISDGVSSGPSYSSLVAMKMIELARSELDRLEDELRAPANDDTS